MRVGERKSARGAGWDGPQGGVIWRVHAQDFSTSCGCRAGLNFAGAEKKIQPAGLCSRNTAAPKNYTLASDAEIMSAL